MISVKHVGKDMIEIIHNKKTYKYTKVIEPDKILSSIESFIKEHYIPVTRRLYSRKKLREEIDSYLIKAFKQTSTDLQWSYVVQSILKDPNCYYRKLKIQKQQSPDSINTSIDL